MGHSLQARLRPLLHSGKRMHDLLGDSRLCSDRARQPLRCHVGCVAAKISESNPGMARQTHDARSWHCCDHGIVIGMHLLDCVLDHARSPYVRMRFTIAREAEVAMKSENRYAMKGGKR